MLLSFTICFNASGYNIVEIRTMYGKAVEDSKTADELLSLLNESNNNDALLTAYKGATESLIAKHAINPYRKLQYLNRSMETLAQAIEKDPANPEIRFLRFSIQYYVPSFLGYGKNLQEDKDVIIKNFAALKKSYAPEIVKGVADFLIKSGKCTAKDIQQINFALL
jgi:hypothetical protein